MIQGGQQGDLPGNRRISFRAGRGRGNDRSGTGTAEFLRHDVYGAKKGIWGFIREIYGDLLMGTDKREALSPTGKKTLYPGVSVYAQLVGSRELFDFADGNQGLNMNSCQQVLNPGIIAQNRRMTAINNAVQVDFAGTSQLGIP